MIQNNLLKNYQKPQNNSLFATNIYDNRFYQQMMMQKEEKIRKIKNVSELGLSKEQIVEYVIAPIKLEKSSSKEIEKYFSDEQEKITKKYIEENWWKKRTNAPYKNILKDEDWTKQFKKEKDLIVHTVSKHDKIGLEEEYVMLLGLLEKHNSDIKVIFSASQENEHKKHFKFVQKYKDRVKYNPKDNNIDLKEYYTKAQKKYDNDQKRLDEAIARLMDEDITDKEIKELESEIIKPSKSKKTTKQEKNIDDEIKELVKELGEDVLKDLDTQDTKKKAKITIKKLDENNLVDNDKIIKKIRITRKEL
uniref:Uncharacterized protein n=1 Tax=viral metagenome TaxID=1070528 RepID=A0A6C0DZS5_9ZZZZ